MTGAERLYRQVLATDQNHVQTALMLGRLLVEKREFEEARCWLSIAANSRAGDPEMFTLLGICHFECRQMGEAELAFQTALRLDPRSPQGRVGMARTLAATSRPDAALAMLAPILAARPDAAALEAAGQACFAAGRNDEAVVHFGAAAALRPTAALLTDLAWALSGSGRFDDALAQFDGALRLDPTNAAAIAGRAHVLESLGRTDEARAAARAAVSCDPTHASAAVTFARLHRAPETRAEAARVLESALQSSTAAPSQRASVLFALGTLKDGAGDYDGAFACFKAANELGPHGFDAAHYRRAMQEVMEAFSAPKVARMARSSIQDPCPVFIVGMPRSGTSLVEQILASHPMAHGAGELDDLGNLAVSSPRIAGSGTAFPLCFQSFDAAAMDRLARVYLDRLHTLGGAAARVTDKMPRNFSLLGVIDRLLPAARVVHCMRHPIDTCFSCYSTHFGPALNYTNSLSDLAAVYRVYREMMDHWRGALSIPILDVRYEDLVNDTANGARRLVEFIGLPWDDRCLRFHENKRVVNTASIDQVRRPIYRSSLQRWKNYESHLGSLAESLREFL